MSAEKLLAANLKRFCGVHKDLTKEFGVLSEKGGKKKDGPKAILKKLSNYLLNPNYTNDVVKYFRSDFLSILHLAIDLSETSNYEEEIHQNNTVILAKLVYLHPDTESFILKYYAKTPAPFVTVKPGSQTLPKRRKVETTKIDDLALVDACYKLLKFKPDFFKSKWEWSAFFEAYAQHKNPMIRWIYSHCVAIYTGMSESALNRYMRLSLTTDEIDELSLKYKSGFERVEFVECEDGGESKSSFTPEGVVYVDGIYLPKYADLKNDSKDIVEVGSTMRNLRRVALGVATNKGVSLLGPVGSGKSCLVEYLANKTGRVLGEGFVKVQLGDQTDSKMLLGTYRCTDVPGEFVWQPGVLTQAVLDGSWLLLEDIDSASMDIASVLSGLIENNYLTVPGYRDHVPITSGFQLFLTQRLVTTITGHHKKHTGANTLLEKNVLSINIEPLTPEELLEIVKKTYPVLQTTASRMVDVFLLFTRNSDHVPKTSRLTSTRDFFKWCTRAIIDFNVSSQTSALKVLQDAIDIFCCSYPNIEDRLNLAKEISTLLGIINEKARYFCVQYKPNLRLTNSVLNVGRACMDCVEVGTRKENRFCFTRPSACLLERVMCCIQHLEPVLLVGETGTGKTSSVQYLANVLGKKLVVINMNQQSDSADLLGGYKPVDFKFVITPIKREFEELFTGYFNVESNRKFLGHISTCFNTKQWPVLVKLMKKSYEAALKRLTDAKDKKNIAIRKQWTTLGVKLLKLDQQLKHKNVLAFAFIEGTLVKAVEKGYWVLLDEINLANAETLECLSGLLEGTRGSISLLERGDKKPVQRHPNFTLFACMNPSTDIGKKDLPAGLRNRFTEFYVEELIDRNDLLLLVNHYLQAMSLAPEKLEKIVKFYLNVRKEAVNSLSDGLGHKPHFSLRSLCRALTIAGKNPCGTFARSLYEAFCLSFLTQLDSNSYKMVEGMIAKHMLGSPKEANAILKQQIPQPKTPGTHLQFEDYWILKGELEPVVLDDYILTQSVRKNLRDLARVVSIGRLPVLLQGDTSVGKTSLITYLAKASGYKCVRINNHEHTDLQEYIGSYAANIEGKLEFREGLLVQAMRSGHWIILDELNLAPSDVLEALNRVLDDNRELFIPETQDTVKAHPNFMLFATQNPPGAYGGRKMLSRAFRNRFVELHFNEIPHDELEFILHKRCQMAPSYAKKMINVMKDLQMRRRGSAAFAGKQGFITLRDLFRWGERYRLAENVSSLYDWDQHLADEGYLLLAGRVRKDVEREEIAEAIQKHMKRAAVPANLFTLSEKTSSVTKDILETIMKNKDKHKNIVWTYNMRQLAVLVCKALQFKEPVLLVGETGGGKTTVCNLIAENNGQHLVTVNCHMHTESSDFIGGLRPVRDHTEENLNKLFEWVDGPLVQAMTEGNLFLADEISLADDSVLERLNSLLEPERTLLLAEKGADELNSELISAHRSFHFVGTMNPGGDFGKKELSPALRNRFTEIWCDSCSNRQDLIDIIEQNLHGRVKLDLKKEGISSLGINIMDFIEWFKLQEIGKRFTVSIRDILTWVSFINVCSANTGTGNAYLHGACLTFLDSLGSGVTSMENPSILSKFRDDCVNFIKNQIKAEMQVSATIQRSEDSFGISPFYIKMGKSAEEKFEFSFNAPTAVYNALRVLRGLQLSKALLLEGSPGVGKTSLVTALAKATRNKIFRVNLSDQTDISDLFGADLPVEGGKAGTFQWRDGPLLQALKKGHWILLDELNLASQSVLEGLNACLDHRGEIFIPELGKTFNVKPGTKFFACQNPLKQGGSRRGLPQSFLNRFTQVYLTDLQNRDLEYILSRQFPKLPLGILKQMVVFVGEVNAELDKHTFAHKGAPWEFNLRDLTRWCEGVIYHQELNRDYHPEDLVNLIFVDRLRTGGDKMTMETIFERVFGVKIGGRDPIVYVNEATVVLGDVTLDRGCGKDALVLKQEEGCLVLRTQQHVLRSLAYCVNLNWMSILVGTASSGKSSVVRTLAKLCGKLLRTLSVTSAMDTTDILGGFEQADYTRHLEDLVKRVEHLLLNITKDLFLLKESKVAVGHLRKWEGFIKVFRTDEQGNTMAEETKNFLAKLSKLNVILNDLHKSEIFEGATKREIAELINRARVIRGKVTEENSLNAGGKFEWVDSVLIKCLQEGSWLLVDNVNLCSPAVLDRLNALLEPNGVLTIGERGVDEDGRMVTIKPHPEFRLFLTMDPKNGEISRAMRNRGVEIYILNEEEGNGRNIYDTQSLIQESGLQMRSQRQSLCDIHQHIWESTIGEKPSISSMLQSSFLISQQLLRGTSPKRAFVDTIVDIYCEGKSSLAYITPEAKLGMKETILELLNANLKSAEKNTTTSVTLNTTELQINSKLARIQQHAYLLEHAESKEAELFKFLLLHFFTLATHLDLNLRMKYLKSIPSVKSSIDVLATLSSVIKSQKTEADYPIDFRWLPNTRLTHSDLNACNRNLISIYFTLQTRIGCCDVKITKQQKSFTFLQYLQGVQKKEVEGKIDDPVVRNLLQLLSAFDAELTQYERDLSNAETIEVIALLQHRIALYNFLQVKLKNVKEIDEHLLNSLHVYYKWFVKFAVNGLGLSGEGLHKIIARINADLSHHFSVLRKIGKHYQKALRKPPPLTNATQLEVVPKLHRLLEEFDVYKINFKRENYENDSRRALLIECKQKLDYNFETLTDEFQRAFGDNAVETIEVDDADDDDDVIIVESKARQVKKNTFLVQMQPLLDYYCLLQVLKFRTDLQPVNLKNFKTVPPHLTSLIYKHCAENADTLQHELTSEVEHYLRNAAALGFAKYLRIVGVGGEDCDEDGKVVALGNPVLTYLVQNLLLNPANSNGMIGINLGNYRHVLKMIRDVRAVIWNNLRGISNQEYDLIQCEIAYLKREIDEFLATFARTLNINPEETENVPAKIIEEITALYNNSKIADKNNELTTLVELITQIPTELTKQTSETKNLNAISGAYIILNYTKALLNSKLPFIDALRKISMKKKMCIEEKQHFEVMKESFVMQYDVLVESDQGLNPFDAILKEKIKSLESKDVELGKYVAFRPNETDYFTIVKAVSHGFTTILSPIKVQQLYNNINELITSLEQSLEDNTEFNLNAVEPIERLAVSSVNSFDSFSENLRKYRYTYPDVIEPLLSNMSGMLHGFNMKISLLRKLKQNCEFVGFEENLLGLVKLPVLDEVRCDYRKSVCSYIGEKIHSFITTVFEGDKRISAKSENFRLLKCSLIETINLCNLNMKYVQHVDGEMFTLFDNLLRLFVGTWKKQEEDIAAKKQEEDALYKMKTKCDDKTEDEIADEEFAKLFPSYHDLDFADMQEQMLDDDKEDEEMDTSDGVEYSGLITESDIRFISENHIKYITSYANTEWLKPENPNGYKCDYVKPFMMKCRIFKLLMDKFAVGMSYSFDQEVVGSLSVLAALAENFGNEDGIDEDNLKENYNFYKDSNIEQIKSCYHIIEELNVRIQELLNDWPDHPTLLTIKSIIDRIYAFDMTSPVPRFLTGFDVLLTKCHEWEQNAHSGVTLAQYSLNIGQQMVTWRKLEMSNWKNSLENVYERFSGSCLKHWFYIYEVVTEFVHSETTTEADLISSLQKFIMQSNLAECEGRINLLKVFHCHTTFLTKTKRRDTLMSILWNLYQHYIQFVPNVIAKIKTQKTPIEKKLKDYVKIIRWKDISYWALKDTLLKTHKAIHKYMREFEEVLKQQASPLFVNTTNNEGLIGVQDRPQRTSPKKHHYTLDSALYISKLALKPTEGISESSFLEKTPKYYKISKSLCMKIINNSEYPQLVKQMDCFISQVIATSKHLQELEINTTLPKDKQVSQAKSHLQQKQRALSDLFKELSKIGLSFRKGIVAYKQRDAANDFAIKPIDLSVALSHIPRSRSDDKLLILWDGVEIYYRKSFMRMEILEEALRNPAKDLGMQNVERCKGFGAHLIIHSQQQKQKLISTASMLYQLRYYQMILTDLQEQNALIHTETLTKLQTALKNCLITMNQYKLILNACPDDDVLDNTDMSNLPQLNDSFINNKQDEKYKNAFKHATKIISVVEKVMLSLQKVKHKVPSTFKPMVVPKYVHIPNLPQMLIELKTIPESMENITEVFGGIPMMKSLDFTKREIEGVLLELTNKRDVEESENSTAFQSKVEVLIQKIMIIVQNLNKKHLKVDAAETPQATTEEDEEEPHAFSDNHLSELLLSNMDEDFEHLNIRDILKSVKGVMSVVCELDLGKCSGMKGALEKLIPFVEQALLLYQYFFTQMVSTYRVLCKSTSILLNIFIDLATKGFCIPADLSDEMGESKEGKQSSGMGLGDGEGEKDVSDRIESEDQLEDAQPAGKEKEKEEDKDCKEEEKGIEMSEDFDSKLQDLDKKPNDDSDEEEDANSDAEEQMGETDKGADQLDKEVWSSDNEDEPEEEQGENKGEERGDKGEQEGESQMAAKDGETAPQEEEEQDDGGDNREEQKKDINEMDEQELDDEQVDPYHGNQPELPEPEPMDLPEDLQLDDGDGEDEQGDENPFDIDAMKDQMPLPEEKEDEPAEENAEEKDEDGDGEDDSDEESGEKKAGEAEEEPEEAEDENKKTELGEKDKDEEKEGEQNEEASGMDEKHSKEENAQSMETDAAASADNVQTTESQQQQSAQIEETQQEDNPDKEGVGQSQMEDSTTGHKGQANAQQDSQSQKELDNKEYKKRPGEADTDRTLGDSSEPVKKKLKTMKADDGGDKEQPEQPEGDEDKRAEMYQHIKDAKENVEQVLDTVTKEQAENLKEKEVPSEEKGAEKPEQSQTELPDEEKDEDVEMVDVNKQAAEKAENEKKNSRDKPLQSHPEGDIEKMEDVEIEGDVVETHTVSRNRDTTHHTQFTQYSDAVEPRLSIKDLNELRGEVERQLSVWNEAPSNLEAEKTWEKITSLVSTLAQDLSEQLRLVLEPTQASRLKGDFRTGRRINMRKVIPYIASQFRKDKIWLRRTKPSKREYQIVLAIDDSSSMADNHSKELAFESVALISKALTLLESGQLSILSFGEETEVLHKLTDPFTEKSGSKLLQKFQFDQKKTCVAKLVDFATEMLNSAYTSTSSLLAKLLIVVSDGRGIFSEGETFVQQAVRRAKLSNIFMIFVIVDNPDNASSILDIRKPVFKDGKIMEIKSYMDTFPFPFYIILRDINTLPNVLSDALRQWFEIVSNIDN